MKKVLGRINSRLDTEEEMIIHLADIGTEIIQDTTGKKKK